jgi:DNA-binding XRE family transcriptional regulator
VKENISPKNSPGESGIYNRISVLRAERGVTRQQLADALNVNYQTIGFLERGDYSPSLKLAFGLSEFFNLPVEAIFSTRPLQPLSEQVYGRPLERSSSKSAPERAPNPQEETQCEPN